VENTIERIYADAMEALASASDAEAVNELSIEYLGRKGRITHYLRNISSLPAEQRPQAGKRANEIKRSLDEEFKAC
jgi:phenylalanyl-tRNA synthetase alpha chain